MSTPLVSVIIPTYNRATLITRTIANVFEQSYRNIEVIVIDDGSKDDTPAVLRSLGDRIRIITQSNAGPAVARNRGAKAARGEIIAFQDSDDLWKPTKLTRQVSLLKRFGKSTPCCLCNTTMSVMDGKEWTSFDDSDIRLTCEEGLWLNVAEVLATRFVLFNQSVAIRREIFEKVGGFREDLKYLEDYDLPLRLSLEGPWAIIKEPLIIYGADSPESFSARALKDPIVLRKCGVEIFEVFLARVNALNGNRRLRRLVAHRLRMLRMLLAGTKLRESDSLVGRITGSLLIGAEHYLNAVVRRSPWQPGVVTTGGDERANSSRLISESI
jgi:glycosyltransferase involved in cell wall biosynthesis